MAQLNVAAAGNAEESINLINPRFQAEALRRLRGLDCGVLDNSFYSSANSTGLSRTANNSFMWPLTATNVQNITVGRGMATAYGYDIQSENNVNLTATAPSSGTKYLFIYLEWNLTNPVEAVGSLLIHDNGSSSSWTPPSQDNLITNPIGRYQMPIYRLAVDTTGIVTATVAWEALGVTTIGNPLRAVNANHAEQADVATNSSRLVGEAASVASGVLTLGGKKVYRSVLLYSGTLVLYNTASVNTTATLGESVSVGDLLQIEYDPQYLSGEDKTSNVVFVRVAGLRGYSNVNGFALCSVYGGGGTTSGFTATQDNFSVSGTTLTYKGGYYLPNFANSGGDMLSNNTIAIKRIYKLYI